MKGKIPLVTKATEFPLNNVDPPIKCNVNSSINTVAIN